MLTDFCKKPVDVGDDNSLGQLPAGPNFCQIAIPISTIITHSDWIECEMRYVSYKRFRG